MSLPDEQSEVTYVGNNSTTTVYPITFHFFDAADISAFVIGTNGELTPLVPAAGFTVAGGNGAAGSMTTTLAVPASKHVLIQRNVPLTQPIAFTDIGKFPSSSIDRSLDRLTMQVQQVDRKAERNFNLIDGGLA